MGIKLGNVDAKYIKVGGADCSIYLGDTLLYPQTLVNTYKSASIWKDYSSIIQAIPNS